MNNNSRIALAASRLSSVVHLSQSVRLRFFWPDFTQGGLKTALPSIHVDAAEFENVFEGAKTKRIYNLLTRGPTFWAIATNPLVLPVVEGVLDHDLLVSSLSTIHIGPGEIP
jgi:hypothetical protein